MKRGWVIFAAMFALAMLVMLPLRLALVMAGAEAAGLAARDVRGRAGAGQLVAASWRGAGLGDVDVRLAPLASLGGAVRYEMTGDQLRGAVRFGRGGGVYGMNGRVAVASIGGFAVNGAELAEVDIGFSGGVCTAAAGQIMVQPAGLLAGFGGLSGSPRCEGEAVLVPLASSDGAVRVDLRVKSGGAFRAEVMIDRLDESVRAGLLAAGFQPTPQGLAMKLEGVL